MILQPAEPVATRNVTDILVGVVPPSLHKNQDDHASLEAFIRTQSEFYVLKQYTKWPTPVIEFVSMVTHLCETEADVREAYDGTDHVCNECRIGRNIAINAVNDPESKHKAFVTVITYKEHWPHVPGVEVVIVGDSVNSTVHLRLRDED